MTKAAICVQAFNKADTIIETLDSLAAADQAAEFDLLIFQDGLEGNKFENRYREEHKESRKAIEMWLSSNHGRFKSEVFIPESRGRGTAGTAKVAIDYGMKEHDWIIFSEDDVIYERDSLEWFSNMLTHNEFLRDEVWAIAGESKYFDSKGSPVSADFKLEACQEAEEKNLMSKFCCFRWLPSSCFATTREKWGEFAETRGLPRGPKMVNDRCEAEGKMSLWPIIARCRDIGMHHQKGYSISIHQTSNKVPQKSNYVTSKDFEKPPENFTEFKDNSDIFGRYTSIFQAGRS